MTTIYFIPTIICIVGPSGSGKTTIARHIEKELGIPMLVSYTTRPMRAGEKNGVDHFFVDESEMPSRDKMLAYTNFGGYHYWMPTDEVPYTDPGVCTYVIDEVGLKMLKEQYAEDFIIQSVLIKRDIELLKAQVEEERVKRDFERIQIPESEYDLVIENNDSLESVLAETITKIQTLRH